MRNKYDGRTRYSEICGYDYSIHRQIAEADVLYISECPGGATIGEIIGLNPPKKPRFSPIISHFYGGESVLIVGRGIEMSESFRTFERTEKTTCRTMMLKLFNINNLVMRGGGIVTPQVII